MKVQLKVDPLQNVSPIKSLYYNGDSKITGGAESLEGGTPLRLSIAASMASALIQRNDAIDTEQCAHVAFAFADALIAKFNADGDALLEASKAAADAPAQAPETTSESQK